MDKGLGEILLEAGKGRTAAEKIAVLRKYYSKELLQVLQYTYDDRVKWLLPDGRPPFKEKASKNDRHEFVLYNELRRFYIFLNSPRSNGISKTKREQIFIDIIEELDPDDRELVFMMKDRKIKYITKKNVLEAFPKDTKDWK